MKKHCRVQQLRMHANAGTRRGDLLRNPLLLLVVVGSSPQS